MCCRGDVSSPGVVVSWVLMSAEAGVGCLGSFLDRGFGRDLREDILLLWGREGGREEGREGEREGGTEGGRDGGRREKGGKEGGRREKGGKEGGREREEGGRTE